MLSIYKHMLDDSFCSQRVDLIDCQFQLWQLIEIIIRIGAWQIIAIIDCFFSNKK